MTYERLSAVSTGINDGGLTYEFVFYLARAGPWAGTRKAFLMTAEGIWDLWTQVFWQSSFKHGNKRSTGMVSLIWFIERKADCGKHQAFYMPQSAENDTLCKPLFVSETRRGL